MAEGTSSNQTNENLEQYGDLPPNYPWGTIGASLTEDERSLVKQEIRVRAENRQASAAQQASAAGAVAEHIAANRKAKVKVKHSVKGGEKSVADRMVMSGVKRPEVFAFERRPTFAATPSELPETARDILERLGDTPTLDVVTAKQGGDDSFLFTQSDRDRIEATLAVIDAMSSSSSTAPPSPGLKRKLLESLSEGRPAKKHKNVGSFNENDVFVPGRIDFADHREHDRSDSWFEEVFEYIDRDISILCNEHFGKMVNLDPGEVLPDTLAGIWESFADPLPAYIAEVVNTADDWDTLLRVGVERRLCVAAIIYHIIHLYIFRSTLFGSTETQRIALDSTDLAMVDDEGFKRAEFRATTVRMFLGREKVTTNFYKEVEKLSAQIASLLHPLEDFLRKRKLSQYQEESNLLKARIQVVGFAFENEMEY